jgi:biotin synthase
VLTTPNPEEDKDLQLRRQLGFNTAGYKPAVLEGDNEQQQRLEQALLTPDLRNIQRGGAMSWQQRIERALDERRRRMRFAAACR